MDRITSHVEREYIERKIEAAASAAIEFSALNTDYKADAAHTAKLAADIKAVIETYLAAHDTDSM